MHEKHKYFVENLHRFHNDPNPAAGNWRPWLYLFTQNKNLLRQDTGGPTNNGNAFAAGSSGNERYRHNKRYRHNEEDSQHHDLPQRSQGRHQQSARSREDNRKFSRPEHVERSFDRTPQHRSQVPNLSQPSFDRTPQDRLIERFDRTPQHRSQVPNLPPPSFDRTPQDRLIEPFNRTPQHRSQVPHLPQPSRPFEEHPPEEPTGPRHCCICGTSIQVLIIKTSIFPVRNLRNT